MRYILIFSFIIIFIPNLSGAYAPANNSANSNVWSFLSWLDGSSGIVIGQHVSDDQDDWDDTENENYHEYITELEEDTGKWASFIGGGYLDGTTGFNNRAVSYWDAGGFVQVWLRPHNPWDSDCTDLYSSPEPANCDDRNSEIPAGQSLSDLYTCDGGEGCNATGQSAYTKFHTELDRIAAALASLESSGVEVILFRPLHEVNGTWFWWGGPISRAPADEYILLWRHVFDYMTTTKGLNNLVWVWSCSVYWGAVWNSTERGIWSDYYPGDSYVDIVGVSSYELLADIGSPAKYDSTYRDITATWSKTAGYTNVYEAHEGKANAVQVNSTPYTSRASIAAVDAAADSWYWEWDSTDNGILYVYGDPTGNSPQTKRAYNSYSLKDEIESYGKIVAFTESGPHNNELGTLDLSSWISSVESDLSDWKYVMWWGGNWRIRNQVNYVNFMQDDWIIDRDELSYAIEEIEGITISKLREQ